jgi:RNA polymerase sigma factor (sigma-70 family)
LDVMPDSDGESFRLLYETNYQRIAAYVLRRAASPEDAADALSETFLTAWRRLDALPSGEDATLWLYATARRVLSNQRRSAARRHRLRLISQQPVVESADLTDTGIAAEAFSRLRADDQELLALIAWDGLAHSQLGAVLGCSENAAKLRASRARHRFAQEIATLTADLTTSSRIASLSECGTDTGEAND